jgi:hypothetical protein
MPTFSSFPVLPLLHSYVFRISSAPKGLEWLLAAWRFFPAALSEAAFNLTKVMFLNKSIAILLFPNSY